MHPIDLAAFWPGYAVVACHQASHDTLLISLEPLAEHVPICSRCAKPSPLIHERRIRQVCDRDLLDQRVLLQLPVRRLDCLDCGRVTERIDWLEPSSRLTQRLRAWLEGLLQLHRPECRPMALGIQALAAPLSGTLRKAVDIRGLAAQTAAEQPLQMQRGTSDDVPLAALEAIVRANTSPMLLQAGELQTRQITTRPG